MIISLFICLATLIVAVAGSYKVLCASQEPRVTRRRIFDAKDAQTEAMRALEAPGVTRINLVQDKDTQCYDLTVEIDPVPALIDTLRRRVKARIVISRREAPPKHKVRDEIRP